MSIERAIASIVLELLLLLADVQAGPLYDWVSSNPHARDGGHVGTKSIKQPRDSDLVCQNWNLARSATLSFPCSIKTSNRLNTNKIYRIKTIISVLIEALVNK